MDSRLRGKDTGERSFAREVYIQYLSLRDEDKIPELKDEEDMMNIEELRNAMPNYAKDIKLNLGNVITETGSPGLNKKQINFILLTSAYSSKNTDIIAAAVHETREQLTPEEVIAAKSAAIIMAMNNIYYRFTHAMDDAYSTMPANLRMTVMAKSGTDKTTFELGSLAASIINGCSKCMVAHTKQLEALGISKEGTTIYR